MKTSDEFLEELKEILIDDLIRYHDQDDDYNHGRNEAARTYLGEIEYFQAEQKQVSNSEKEMEKGFDFAIEVVNKVLENLEEGSTLDDFKESLEHELELMKVDG